MNDYEKSIAEVESVMNRYYRGDSIDDQRGKLNALVKEYNALVERSNAEKQAADKKLEAELAPLYALKKQVKEMDAKLEKKPNTSDARAVSRYNALLKRRNALVKRANSASKAGQASIDRHNASVRRRNAEIASHERAVEAARGAFNSRVEAHDEFRKSDRNVAFFKRVNRLYAALRAQKRRSRGSSTWDRPIAKMRAVRRELGAYAISRHRSNKHGLVTVEVALGDEPCVLIVDTGAAITTIAPDVVEAMGLSDRLGKETEFNLAGGKKMKGRELTLPRLTVAGTTETDVLAAAADISEVGVDGLLGQSFLKRFVYTIDESSQEKLILRRTSASSVEPRKRR